MGKICRILGNLRKTFFYRKKIQLQLSKSGVFVTIKQCAEICNKHMPLHMKLPENSATPGFYRGFICLWFVNFIPTPYTPTYFPHTNKIFPSKNKCMEIKEQHTKKAPFDKRVHVFEMTDKIEIVITEFSNLYHKLIVTSP